MSNQKGAAQFSERRKTRKQGEKQSGLLLHVVSMNSIDLMTSFHGLTILWIEHYKNECKAEKMMQLGEFKTPVVLGQVLKAMGPVQAN